jgi:glycosyltransferase involved in cell wall biosynthesis
MLLLVNASNIKQSGAYQVTISFLNELKNIPGNKYILVLNTLIYNSIDEREFDENFTIVKIDFVSPSQGEYKNYIRELDEIVRIHSPDCVFSVFGPAYWRPKVVHLVGFAHGWGVNPDSIFFKTLNILKKGRIVLSNAFKRFFFKRDADFHVVETDVVKNRLSRYYKIPLERIFVVGNTYNHFFTQNDPKPYWLSSLPVGFRLLTISSNFPHKNLKILKDVNKLLIAKGVYDVHFILTIPEADLIKDYGEEYPNIFTTGTVKPSDCPALYEVCDAMILPTLLESFSACYPEAMKSEKPILTSDLDFARNICGDAALYFDPLDASSIADNILLIRNDLNLRRRLIEAGSSRLRLFPTALERAESYVAICKRIVGNRV